MPIISKFITQRPLCQPRDKVIMKLLRNYYRTCPPKPSVYWLMMAKADAMAG